MYHPHYSMLVTEVTHQEEYVLIILVAFALGTK